MKPLPKELEDKIDEIKSWMFANDQKLVARNAKLQRRGYLKF